MMHPGLVSITFRELSPAQIIDLVGQADLPGIEWGGDVHVPHGDLRRAREVNRMCHNASLQIYSFGSYYILGQSRYKGLDFTVVLETAKNLGTDMIRIWAGSVGSAQADSAHRDQITSEAREIAEIAAKAGLKLSFEFHCDTLADTAESALELLEEIDRDNVFTYWQPPNYVSFEERKDSLRTVLQYVSNIHVFHWACNRDGFDRLPLQDGVEQWQEYIDIIKKTGREYALMLEYVKDDSPAQFRQDAQTLTGILL